MQETAFKIHLTADTRLSIVDLNIGEQIPLELIYKPTDISQLGVTLECN